MKKADPLRNRPSPLAGNTAEPLSGLEPETYGLRNRIGAPEGAPTGDIEGEEVLHVTLSGADAAQNVPLGDDCRETILQGLDACADFALIIAEAAQNGNQERALAIAHQVLATIQAAALHNDDDDAA